MRKGQLSDSTDQAWVQITPKIVQSEALEILEIQDQGWSLQGQHSHLPVVFSTQKALSKQLLTNPPPFSG